MKQKPSLPEPLAVSGKGPSSAVNEALRFVSQHTWPSAELLQYNADHVELLDVPRTQPGPKLASPSTFHSQHSCPFPGQVTAFPLYGATLVDITCTGLSFLGVPPTGVAKETTHFRGT